MQTTLLFDELVALCGQAKIMFDSLDGEPNNMELSPRQEEWLFDILYSHGKQKYWQISDRGVGFLLQVVSGKYSKK